MSPQMRGVLVPITTPFDPVTGDVAAVPLRANARKFLDQGVSGIVVAGSTGEAPLLSEDEYRQVIGWLREVVPDDRLLVAGSGRESTRAVIAACRVAAAEGADAVLVRPPSYYAPLLTAWELVEHFRRVADDSPLPVLLYNMPKFTHVMLDDTVFDQLAGHANIVGAKDSSGDLKSFAAYREAAPDWALFMGSGAHFYAGLELGAVGGILAVAGFATGLAIEVDRAYGTNDRSGAGAAQEVLSPLHKTLVGELGVPGVKAAMDAVGLEGGRVRSPLRDLGPEARERVGSLVRAAGLSAEPEGIQGGTSSGRLSV
jgi:dihydrodipicolinate synthase/N-acetylneuraminate lyase